MYQHILFDNDAYYFNGNWAMKYMENYGWRKHTKKEKKQRLDKWNNLEYLNKEYGNDKKFDADCLEIMREFENKVCLSAIRIILDSYRRLYVSVGETTPAMLYIMCPAVWWALSEKNLSHFVPDDAEINFVPCDAFLELDD